MMRKYQSVMKRVVVEGVVAAGLVVACAAANWFVSGIYETKLQQESALQGEISAAQGEVTQTKERLDNAGASYKKYGQLREYRHTMEMTLNRNQLTDLLATLKDKYRLSSLNLQLMPDAALENEKLKAAHVNAIQSGVQLSFGGISDEHLLSFTDDLLRSAPGLILISDMTLARSKAFDIDVMRDVSRGGKPEMATAKLDMKWFGFASEAP